MKKLFSILLILSLTACGWHLRGSTQLSSQLSPLYVTAIDSQGALITELREQLKSSHIATVDDKKLANYSVNILEEIKDKRTAGVGSDALSSAYEITYKVNFEIRVKNSEQFEKATAISVRSYNYSTNAINSAAQEEILLEKEIRRELAQQILRRVSAFATHPDQVSTKKPANNKQPAN